MPLDLQRALFTNLGVVMTLDSKVKIIEEALLGGLMLWVSEYAVVPISLVEDQLSIYYQGITYSVNIQSTDISEFL